MATEIANLVHAMVSFTAANPPVIISRDSNVLGVTRVIAGQYTVELVQKIPIGALAGAGAQLQATSKLASAATFVDAIEDGTGDVTVQMRALAGTLADNGARIDLLVLTYPNLA